MKNSRVLRLKNCGTRRPSRERRWKAAECFVPNAPSQRSRRRRDRRGPTDWLAARPDRGPAPCRPLKVVCNIVAERMGVAREIRGVSLVFTSFSLEIPVCQPPKPSSIHEKRHLSCGGTTPFSPKTEFFSKKSEYHPHTKKTSSTRPLGPSNPEPVDLSAFIGLFRLLKTMSPHFKPRVHCND
jgi:hypothetical protein